MYEMRKNNKFFSYLIWQFLFSIGITSVIDRVAEMFYYFILFFQELI